MEIPVWLKNWHSPKWHWIRYMEMTETCWLPQLHNFDTQTTTFTRCAPGTVQSQEVSPPAPPQPELAEPRSELLNNPNWQKCPPPSIHHFPCAPTASLGGTTLTRFCVRAPAPKRLGKPGANGPVTNDRGAGAPC